MQPNQTCVLLDENHVNVFYLCQNFKTVVLKTIPSQEILRNDM